MLVLLRVLENLEDGAGDGGSVLPADESSLSSFVSGK